MLNVFDTILNDEEIINRYNQIHIEEDDAHTWTYHDYDVHVKSVVEDTEKIIKLLNYDDDYINAAKCAAILHDTGCLNGRENHPEKGYKFSEDYLLRKGLDFKYKDLALDAIKNHSEGFDSNNIITLVLVLTDKMDMRHKRLAKWGFEKVGARQYQYIENVDISIDDSNFVIKFDVREGINLEELEEFKYTTKFFKAFKSFTSYINMTPQVYLNDKKWNAFYNM